MLRGEISSRNLRAVSELACDVGYSGIPSVVYASDAEGGHGNFLPASYRRIQANPAWAERLNKSYTGARQLPRAADRWRGELECATSSDALLMNVFCYPGVYGDPRCARSLAWSQACNPSSACVRTCP